MEIVCPIVFFAVIAALVIAGAFRSSQQKAERESYHAKLQSKTTDIPGKVFCSKCNKPMELGFIPDSQEGGYRLINWIEGKPTGTEESVKYTLEKSVPIGAYRCVGCGYLEFYARPEFVPDKSG
jgi:hypothetical protein